MKTMFCPKCGTNVNENFKFCYNCGFDLSSVANMKTAPVNEKKEVGEKATETDDFSAKNFTNAQDCIMLIPEDIMNFDGSNEQYARLYRKYLYDNRDFCNTYLLETFTSPKYSNVQNTINEPLCLSTSDMYLAVQMQDKNLALCLYNYSIIFGKLGFSNKGNEYTIKDYSIPKWKHMPIFPEDRILFKMV